MKYVSLEIALILFIHNETNEKKESDVQDERSFSSSAIRLSVLADYLRSKASLLSPLPRGLHCRKIFGNLHEECPQ